MMKLSSPVPQNAKILFYARFSTDEQRQQSIEDQFAYCKSTLEAECRYSFPSIHRLSDEGLSGELKSRPGIDEVRRLIEMGLIDCLVVEDSSRLYRGVGMCDDLVARAVDNDIRVLCFNDRIDTLEEDWRHRLSAAQQHHSQDNYYTRFRIKRALEGLWRMGAAIGPLVSGYRREVQEGGGKRPPKFDHIDPEWAPSILRAYEEIAIDVAPDLVAESLTSQGMPKTSNALIEAWTAANVISMIRNPKYRGYEKYRVTVAKKKYVSGRSHAERNPDPEKILERWMPHLRIVEDAVWDKANAVIDGRITRDTTRRGKDHPLNGIPRNSRGPFGSVDGMHFSVRAVSRLGTA